MDGHAFRRARGGRLDYRKVPTGAIEPAEKIFPGGKGALKDYNLDDVFSDLTRDAQGRATAVLKGRKQQLEISQGPNYKSLVIYSPNPTNTGLGSQVAPPNPNRAAAPRRAPADGGGGGRGRGNARRRTRRTSSASSRWPASPMR